MFFLKTNPLDITLIALSALLALAGITWYLWDQNRKGQISFRAWSNGFWTLVLVGSFLLGMLVFGLSGQNPNEVEWFGVGGILAIVATVAPPVGLLLYKRWLESKRSQ